MSSTHMPAEVFPPGEYLRDELEERGWTETEFAEIIGRPLQAVSEILNDKKEITAETALAFGDALGTSAELWLNLQASYRLHTVRSVRPEQTAVARRATLRSLVPVRELQKREWLPTTDDLDVLEAAVCDFLGIPHVDEPRHLAAAARRSHAEADFTPEQRAWICRVQQLGRDRVTVPYDPDRARELAEQLVRRIRSPQDLSQLKDWMAECGIALVIELPLKGSKIDGVLTFSASGSPIIGLSTRGDRMDGFVFTLLHELAHLLLGHVKPGETQLDEDILEEQESALEREANDVAGRWVLPQDIAVGTSNPKLNTLITLARRQGVHVSFVIGRLQNDGLLEWSRFRRSIPKVRPFLDFG